MNVCVNVCVREERERDRKTPSDVFTGLLIYCASAFLVCVCVFVHMSKQSVEFIPACVCVSACIDIIYILQHCYVMPPKLAI